MKDGDPITRQKVGLGRLIVPVLLVAVLAWLAGLFWFVAHLPAPKTDRAAASNDSTDGIVVLTGGVARIEGGLRLLEAHPKSRLLISGVDPRIERKNLRATLSHGQEAFDCCVDLGRTATDTWGNAREIAAWAKERDYHSLTIVTANYHMPRSLIEIHLAVPHISLVVYPVISSNVPVEGWWWHPHTAVLIASEYSKYLLSRIASPLSRSLSLS